MHNPDTDNKLLRIEVLLLAGTAIVLILQAIFSSLPVIQVTLGAGVLYVFCNQGKLSW